MKLIAYTIYDRKALTYSPPFYMQTDGLACRALQDLVNDHNTSVGRYPSDFVLYAAGNWDDLTATWSSITPLRHVMDASALVALPNKAGMDSLLQAPDLSTFTKERT